LLTGDAAARKNLDAINREAALHDSGLRSLDAAIAEAGKRVEAQRASEQQAQARGDPRVAQEGRPPLGARSNARRRQRRTQHDFKMFEGDS
jgi:hypothetical protein